MTTKETIIFVATVAVVGAGAFAGGYFIGKHKMKKDTDAIINQMNDEINDYVMQLTDKEVTEKVVVNGVDYTNAYAYSKAKELARRNEEMKKKYWDMIHEKGYKQSAATEKGPYSVNNDNNNDDVDDDYEEDNTEPEDKADRSGIDIVADEAMHSDLPPYIIDENDYMDSQFDAFSKHEFTYFGDGTLIDDGDEIIPNPADIVGLDNLIELETGNADRIYVRNEAFLSDYEIVFKEMSYKEFMGDVE